MSLDPHINMTSGDKSAAEVSVLIVDDHIAVAKLVAKLFKGIGIARTAIAFDTQIARQHVVEQRPNIVVVDANAGPMRAAAFITLMKRLPLNNPVILLMTTSMDSEAVLAAREAGVDGVLLQPFTPSVLGQTLQASMHSRSIAESPPGAQYRSMIAHV